MKKYYILFMMIVFLLSGCGGGSGSISTTTSSSAGGAGAKGPFIQGSTVTAYKLENNGSRSLTVNAITTQTIDNLGNYSFSSLGWSGPTELVITGKYFNENNASISSNSATLRAVVNVKAGEKVNANINVFTDLAAKRALELMKSGTTIDQAKAQAKVAIINLFDLNISAGVELEDLDLTDGNSSNVQANAELLRVSAAIASTPNLIESLEEAIADGNVTDDANGSLAFSTLVRKVKDVNLSQVSQNIKLHLGVSDVPDANDSDDNVSYISNLYPPIITSDGGGDMANVAVSENSIGITTVRADDNDTASVIAYFIAGGEDNQSFMINSMTGILTFKTAPDFENPTDANNDNVYEVLVGASDGTYVDTQLIKVSVTNVDDVLPVLANSMGSVVENAAAGTVVGNVNIISSGDSNITNMILNGVGDGNFDISSAGVVTVKSGANIDFESTRDFNLSVRAQNSAGLSNTAYFYIRVNDMNDNPPVITSHNSATVDENNISVLTVTATDADTVSTVSYYLTGGSDIALFSLDANSGVLKFKNAPDFENPADANQDNIYNITVTATDGDHNTTQDITISVSNIIDTPPTLAPMNVSVAEGTVIGSIIGELNVTNEGDSNITSITLDDSSNFFFDSNGKLKTKIALDYESKSEYNLSVFATNTAGNSNSVGIYIKILDVNEPPVADDGNYTTSEDTNITIDLKPLISDPDNGDQVSVINISSPSNGSVSNNGDGTVTYSPNNGYTGSDSFTYEVEDRGNLTDTGTINITVNAATTTSTEGTAVDPYIVGARFWADVDGDGVIDANELSTYSDINGSFEFNISIPDDTNITMVEQGLHNGLPFDGNLSARYNSNTNGIISPITSLGFSGFSDTQIITALVSNGMTATDFNATISAAELYMDPFDPALLPIDGNMTGYSDEQIQRLRRVLIANVAINSALTMANGYELGANTIQQIFFDDPDGSGPAISPLAMMIEAGKMAFTYSDLKNSDGSTNGHARVRARIFVTVSSYMRDVIANEWSNGYSAMAQVMQTESQNIPSMIGSLVGAYQNALGNGIVDPIFGWVNVSGSYVPMLFIQPEQLGKHDVTIVYSDINGADHNVTFSVVNHDYAEDGTVVGQWQVSGRFVQTTNAKQYEFLGKNIKINGILYPVMSVYYNHTNFINSNNPNSGFVTVGDKEFLGAAAPGDFARFSFYGNLLRYRLTGAVYGDINGSIAMTDLTGSGIFYVAALANNSYIKVAKFANLGIGMIPYDSNGHSTMVFGLEQVNSIQDSDVEDKDYLYAHMEYDLNGNITPLSGFKVRLNSDKSISVYQFDGNIISSSGCWKNMGDHLVVALDDSLCGQSYPDLGDDNAYMRVIVKPATQNGRSGFIVDGVSGSFVGVGLEQKILLINDMNGTFDAYLYAFDGSYEELVQINVTNDGQNASYTLVGYNCTTNGCTLDPNYFSSQGSLLLNQDCEGHNIAGVACVQDASGAVYTGFIDKDEGYFIMANDDQMIFGSKH